MRTLAISRPFSHLDQPVVAMVSEGQFQYSMVFDGDLPLPLIPAALTMRKVIVRDTLWLVYPNRFYHVLGLERPLMTSTTTTRRKRLVTTRIPSLITKKTLRTSEEKSTETSPTMRQKIMRRRKKKKRRDKASTTPIVTRNASTAMKTTNAVDVFPTDARRWTRGQQTPPEAREGLSSLEEVATP